MIWTEDSRYFLWLELMICSMKILIKRKYQRKVFSIGSRPMHKGQRNVDCLLSLSLSSSFLFVYRWEQCSTDPFVSSRLIVPWWESIDHLFRHFFISRVEILSFIWRSSIGGECLRCFVFVIINRVSRIGFIWKRSCGCPIFNRFDPCRTKESRKKMANGIHRNSSSMSVTETIVFLWRFYCDFFLFEVYLINPCLWNEDLTPLINESPMNFYFDEFSHLYELHVSPIEIETNLFIVHWLNFFEKELVYLASRSRRRNSTTGTWKWSTGEGLQNSC